MRNSVKLGIFAITAVLFASISLVTFKVNAQTNQVHCVTDPVSTVCILDTNISPNPDCSPGYEPDCAGSTGAFCCTPQGASCSNVPCVFTGAPAETCPPTHGFCIQVPHWTECVNRGGLTSDCLPAVASGLQLQGKWPPMFIEYCYQ